MLLEITINPVAGFAKVKTSKKSDEVVMSPAISVSESYEKMIQCIQERLPQILADDTQMARAIEALEQAWGYAPCESHIRRRMAQYLYFSYLPGGAHQLNACWQWRKCEADVGLDVSMAHNASEVCAVLLR